LAHTPFLGREGRLAYDDFLPAALWCAVLGYVCFLLGYASTIPAGLIRRLPKAKVTWPKAIPTLTIGGLLFIGTASLIYLFKIGQTVGNYTNRQFQDHPPPGIPVLFANGIDVAWVAVCLFLLLPGRPKNRTAALFLLPMCLAVLILRMGISGGKVSIIEPALEAAVVIHYGFRRLRIWELLAGGLPILLLAFGVMNFYRFVVVAQHGPPKSFADVVSLVSSTSELLRSHHKPAAEKSALEQLVARDAGVDSLALIIKYTPHPFPYKFGAGWAITPLTFIPRQIWKNKPVDLPSADFETTYMAEPAKYNGFSSMHLIADFYRNFSYFGVVVGLFGMGVAMRFFYLFCAPSRENPPGIFLYACVFPAMVHSFEADFASMCISLSRIVLFVVACAYVLGIRYKRVRPQAGLRPTYSSVPVPSQTILQVKESF
jgi:hypothetical protein